MFRRRDSVGQPDLPLLSVYRDFGVVPRAGREDNFNKASDDLSSYRVVQPGDLVLNKMKTWQGSLGISDYYGIVSPAYFVCEQIGTGDARFLHHLLRSRPLIAEYGARSKGIRPSQWDLPWNEFRDIRVNLPAVSVQRRIAEFLDSETERIDALIEKKRQMISVLDVRTESLIASVLDPIISASGETPLKFLAELRVSNVDKKSYEGERPIRLCNYTDVYYNRRVTPGMAFMEATATAEQVKRLELRDGDVLITKDSETADDIAVPSLVVGDIPGVVLGYHLAMLRPGEIDGAFLYWCLRSRRCRDLFSLAASGVTRFGLRQDAVGRVSIPTLDRADQPKVVERIEHTVSGAERIAVLLDRQIERLVEHRQALITAAVTGELDLSDAA